MAAGGNGPPPTWETNPGQDHRPPLPLGKTPLRPPPPLGVRPSAPPPLGTRPPAPPLLRAHPPLGTGPPAPGQGYHPPAVRSTGDNDDDMPIKHAYTKSPEGPKPYDGSSATAEGKPKDEEKTGTVEKGTVKRDTEGGKVKMGFVGLGKRPAKSSGITMKLKPQTKGDTAVKKPKVEPIVHSKPTSKLVAQAFGSDSEEEEEMPPEAKLRMKNIGRDTPTSSGPNSFYKTGKGFTDPRGSWRNELEKDY